MTVGGSCRASNDRIRFARRSPRLDPRAKQTPGCDILRLRFTSPIFSPDKRYVESTGRGIWGEMVYTANESVVSQGKGHLFLFLDTRTVGPNSLGPRWSMRLCPAGWWSNFTCLNSLFGLTRTAGCSDYDVVRRAPVPRRRHRQQWLLNYTGLPIGLADAMTV